MALSHTIEDVAEQRFLHPGAVLRVLVLLVVAFLFGLAHLQLRFNIKDMDRDTARLQSLKTTLSSEINVLRSENESLKHPERLLQYGRAELGMVPFNQAQTETLEVPEEVFTRYAMARATLREPAPRDLAGGPRQTQWVEVLGDRLGLNGNAVANPAR